MRRELESENKSYAMLLQHYNVKIEPTSREETSAGPPMKRSFFCFLFLASFSWSAFAHEMRPAYLQMRQTASDTYDIFWKVPASGDLRLSLHVELPQLCSNLTEPRGSFSGGAFSENWSVRCEGGLPGSTIHIDGLTATLTDVSGAHRAPRWFDPSDPADILCAVV